MSNSTICDSGAATTAASIRRKPLYPAGMTAPPNAHRAGQVLAMHGPEALTILSCEISISRLWLFRALDTELNCGFLAFFFFPVRGRKPVCRPACQSARTTSGLAGLAAGGQPCRSTTRGTFLMLPGVQLSLSCIRSILLIHSIVCAFLQTGASAVGRWGGRPILRSTSATRGGRNAASSSDRADMAGSARPRVR